MKRFRHLLLLVVMLLCMNVLPALGAWQSDANGWWWQNADGSYPAAAWQWIDADGDGKAACYYFDAKGYCLLNTVTPDGCQVDESGAWVKDKQVQYRQLGQSAQQTAPAQGKATALDSGKQSQGVQDKTGELVYISRTGKKYHRNPKCSGMKNPGKVTREEAEAMGREACKKCY